MRAALSEAEVVIVYFLTTECDECVPFGLVLAFANFIDFRLAS